MIVLPNGNSDSKHIAAFQAGVQTAFDALASGRKIPWKRKRKPIAIDRFLSNCSVRNLFRALHTLNVNNELLVGNYEKMNNVINQVGPLYDSLQQPVREACRQALEKILSYENFQKGYGWSVENGKIAAITADWSGSEYISQLGVTVCPYCNAEKLQRDTTVEFDHYLQKSDYPYLRLCLYNIIPVCSTCNTKRKRFSVDNFTKYAYPYRDSVHAETRFSIEIPPLGEQIGSLLLELRKKTDPDRSKLWLENLGIKDQYEINYKDHIEWIQLQANNFGNEVHLSREKLIGRRETEKLYGKYFKCSLDWHKINVEPLSKLTIDLVEVFSNGGIQGIQDPNVAEDVTVRRSGR